MRKTLSCLLTAVMVSLTSQAAVLTPTQALTRAGLAGAAPAAAASAPQSAKLVYTVKTQANTPAVYVFENVKGTGYSLISADDVAMPVLGYSDSFDFDPANIPPVMSYWLSEYAREIEYASAHGAYSMSVPARALLGQAVEPLVKAKWNQGSPYNLFTPLAKDNSGNMVHCVTGCVATAMAQVMNYWQYPAKGTGKVSARVTSAGQQTKVWAELDTIPLNWDKMTATYGDNSTKEQREAVARLMMACGYSCDMGYTANESGAYSINMANALVKNFGYNPNISLEDRNYYSGTDWNKLVYNELAAGRPVLYAGASLTGAHQFVVDGYSSDGYFHLNWGWGGMSDGYFTLNALDPGAQGIGGSAGGYNFGQSMVKNVQIEKTPDVAQDPILMVMNGYVDGADKGGNVLAVNISQGGFLSNGSAETLNGYLLFTVQNTATGETTVIDTNPEGSSWYFTDLLPGWGWGAWEFEVAFPASLPDGNYKVTMCCRKEGTSENVPVKASVANYFTVAKNGETLSVTNPGTARFTVTGSLQSGLYKGIQTKVFAEVVNNTSVELTQGVYPALYDMNGNRYYQAEGYMITLQPGETWSKQWLADWKLVGSNTAITKDTQFVFKFFDPATNQSYGDGELVTMKINGTPELAVEEVHFRWLQNFDYTGKQAAYVVPNPLQIPVKMKVRNSSTKAYWGAPVYLGFVKEGDNYTSAIVPIPDTPFIGPGESTTIEGNVVFSNYEDYATYYVGILFVQQDGSWGWINVNNSWYPIRFTVDTSGIGDIVADTEAEGVKISYSRQSAQVNVASEAAVQSLAVYAIDGATVATAANTATMSLANLPAGIYVVSATDAMGHTATVKVIR